MMQSMEEFANAILDKLEVDGQVWTMNKAYKPGDLVFGSLQDAMTGTQYECRQAPFGDFCSQYHPAYQQNVRAWREYKKDGEALPEPTTKILACIDPKTVEKFKKNDRVCDGRYVFKCLNDKDCNAYPLGAEDANYAWALINAYAEGGSGPATTPASTTEPTVVVDDSTAKPATSTTDAKKATDTTKKTPAKEKEHPVIHPVIVEVYDEPTEEELKEYMNGFPLRSDFQMVNNPYILPISIQEFWDTFYADHSLFSSQLSHAASETFGVYTDWYEPEEDKFKTFDGTPVKQQRDMQVDFKLPRNPIYS
jgi:hypothetical protein